MKIDPCFQGSNSLHKRWAHGQASEFHTVVGSLGLLISLVHRGDSLKIMVTKGVTFQSSRGETSEIG